MARPRITSIIAKWLFGETITSGEKSTLRASLGSAPATGINPSSIEGTAATITGNNIFSGENTFNSTSNFNGQSIFSEITSTFLTVYNLTVERSGPIGNRVIFTTDTLTGERTQALSDFQGTIPSVPAYSNITEANEDLSTGDFFWDTTLKKLRVATS